MNCYFGKNQLLSDFSFRLLEQLPQQMEPHAVRWGKLVYPLLLHGAPKLRERALVAVDLGMPAMLKHREELGKTLMADLKAVSTCLGNLPFVGIIDD